MKPLLSALVLASAVAVPAFAEELSTFKDHLLYCEEVVEHDDDFTVFRQYFEACITEPHTCAKAEEQSSEDSNRKKLYQEASCHR